MMERRKHTHTHTVPYWNMPVSSGLLSKYLCSKGLRGFRDVLQGSYFVGRWVITPFRFLRMTIDALYYCTLCTLCTLSALPSWSTASRSLRLLSSLAYCSIRLILLHFCRAYICMHLVAPYVIVFVSSYLYVVHVLLAMSLL